MPEWRFGDMLVVGDRYPAILAMYLGPYLGRTIGPAGAASWLWPISELPADVEILSFDRGLLMVALNNILTLVDD